MSNVPYAETASFLLENCTVNENGNKGSVTQKAFKTLAKQHGVTDELLKQVKDFHTELIGGMSEATARKLEESIAEAKKSGDDPKDRTFSLSVTTPEGPMVMTRYAHRQHTRPSDRSKIDVYGSARLKIAGTRCHDPEAQEKIEARIAKALGV